MILMLVALIVVYFLLGVLVGYALRDGLDK